MIITGLLIVLFVCFGLVVLVGAPYVPSLRKDVRTAFDELYPISKNDVVLDVGSGDGTILREISRRGGSAVGYEINPILVFVATVLNRSYPNIHVKLRNFWTTSFPADTTMVYAFIVSRDTKRLARKMQHEADRLKTTLYLLSYGATITDKKPTKQASAHHLYTFVPLHQQKAQV